MSREAIFCGEILGTFLLILLGNGVVANVLLQDSKGERSGWMVISSGWAVAVTIALFTAGWMSGGQFNPAVTLGLAIVGKTAWNQIGLYFSAQLIGAMLGAIFVWLVYYPHWEKTHNPLAKLQVFATTPAVRRPFWNLVCEVVATAVLMLGILGIFDAHNGVSQGFGPYAVGLLVLSIGLCLGGPTGYAINPARDLGPRLVHTLLPIAGKGSGDWGYAWVPLCGPFLGSALGALLYRLLLEKL